MSERRLTMNVCVPVDLDVTVSDVSGEVTVVAVHGAMPPPPHTVHESMDEEDFDALEQAFAKAAADQVTEASELATTEEGS